MTKIVSSSNLGGPYNGFSPIQTLNNFKDGEQTMIRRVLLKSWNGKNASGKINGYNRVITPFRAVTNSGDFLARNTNACAGGSPNPISSRPNIRGISGGSFPKGCDASNIPGASCNSKFVPDSSDYIRFKKYQAFNKNYNDSSNGGDQNNGSYVSLMAVRRR
jgi:hypothetical protein